MLLTECCNSHNPTMVEVEDKCRKCGDWIEIHDGKPVCKSGCPQEITLPQLDSIEDGPIDGYDY